MMTIRSRIQDPAATHSTASSCCDALRPVLALNCMMNSTNSTTQQQLREGDHAPSLAYGTCYVCHPESPRSVWGEGSAFRSYSSSPPAPSTGPKLLDSVLTYTKQMT